MTTAAIICPGPSAARTLSHPGAILGAFGFVVAVNRAVLLPGLSGLVDWHVCGDWSLLWPLGRHAPRICTTADVVRLSADQPAFAGCDWMAWEELGITPRYSTIAALGLAAKLGAEHVTMFGDDKQGLGDWDGTTAGRRTEDRWADERALQAKAIAQLGLNVTYRGEPG